MNKIISFLKQFFTLKDTPHRIAAGAAVGLFMGIMPLEGVTASLVIAVVFRLNKMASLMSVAITNAWAMIAVLPLVGIIGGSLFGVSPQQLIDQFYLVYQTGGDHIFTREFLFELTLPLVIGYTLVAGIISLVFYFFLYTLLKRRE